MRDAITAVLAVALGVVTGHAVAQVVAPAASPVLAIGSTAIDLTPTWVKEWAVSHFGTADKLVLISGVLLVTLAVAAAVGALAARRAFLVPALVVVLGALAAAAALSRPAATAIDAVPAVVATIVGLATRATLTRVARRGHGRQAGPISRRGFLLASVGAAVLTVGIGALAQARQAGQTMRRLVLPRPAHPAPPLPTGLEAQVPGISPLRTPVSVFYRVDTNLAVPDVDPATWSLTVDGLVQHPFTITLEDLLALPLIERDITMTCVSNEVGGSYVGSARWLGVPLKDLLDRAQVRGRPDQVLSTAVDGFTISTPLGVATDGRDAMVAVGMNGAALPPVHGFPARLLVPGLYGFVGATKWLTRLTLSTYAEQQAYWTRRQWATDAPVKTGSRIDTPAPLSTIPAGRTAVGGVAWAQHRGIGRVEVRVDGGPWEPARLGPDVGVDYWRQWWLPWDATPGPHRLAVRATDGTGATQPETRATPFPNGASGIPEIVVTAT